MAATSNPAARAARAVPRPTRIVLFGAARREIPLVELAIIVSIEDWRDIHYPIDQQGGPSLREGVKWSAG